MAGQPRLLVNCPVCDMTKPATAIVPHRYEFRLRHIRVENKTGTGGIRNITTPVDDLTTRRMVLARLRTAVDSALAQLDEAIA